MPVKVCVTASEKSLEDNARKLAASLKVDFVTDIPNTDFVLMMTKEKLELFKPKVRTKPLYVDFSSFKLRQGREPVVKATGLKNNHPLSILDLTAGLGQDAFVLASAGCSVTMCERSKVIAALLQDGLKRALQDEKLNPIVRRMRLVQQDGFDFLQNLEDKPDVIYLDPMYPGSGKSAAKRKSMAFFRELVGDDLDAGGLLGEAQVKALERVIVKRPLKAQPLNGQKPNFSLKGKTTRFDIYLSHA